VIKVERSGSGDFARQYDNSVNGLSSYFVWLNRSKESIALDVKTIPGREVLHELVDLGPIARPTTCSCSAKRALSP
jgi:itaconate CoA-transferase